MLIVANMLICQKWIIVHKSAGRLLLLLSMETSADYRLLVAFIQTKTITLCEQLLSFSGAAKF